MSTSQPPSDQAVTAGANLSSLTWLMETAGREFVKYILNCGEALDSILSGTTTLTPEQAANIEILDRSLRGLPEDIDPTDRARAFLSWLSSPQDNGQLTAQMFHLNAGGQQVGVPAADDLEKSIATLADAAYSSLLLPDEFPEMFDYNPRVSSYAGRAIFGHPSASDFGKAVIDDPALGRLFSIEGQHTGRVTDRIYISTGIAHSIQLLRLPEIILTRAWHSTPLARQSPPMFVEAALKEFRNIRSILSRKRGMTAGKFAFAGILLPEGSELTLKGASVRSATDEDRKLAPSSLKGQTTATDSSGLTTTANYDGDIVLAMQIPIAIRFADESSSDLIWPDDMRLPDEVETTINRLRFGLIMAVERESRALLIPTWQHFDDPLDTTATLSWFDPRHGPGFMPIQLTADEVRSWALWYERLSKPYVAKIDLAISRILKASGERRDPSDVLIDSVIAWERLFGTKEGEPTFRISTSIAMLLSKTFEERMKTKAKLSKIYGLRSKVVHGSEHLKPSEYEFCYEALDVAIRAVRTLLLDRTDILQLPDGAARSSALLLGAKPSLDEESP
ncbi:hypothetical protein ACFY2Q_03380 [Micromonospora sp. NPDC000316]|uniref:hypothetical protein n=1 Tax=Micromonospora sp. NPDC000316 TaxID=3364216 RepID=UPI0036AA8039